MMMLVTMVMVTYKTPTWTYYEAYKQEQSKRLIREILLFVIQLTNIILPVMKATYFT